jgi:hypothetical protein
MPRFKLGTSSSSFWYVSQWYKGTNGQYVPYPQEQCPDTSLVRGWVGPGARNLVTIVTELQQWEET